MPLANDPAERSIPHSYNYVLNLSHPAFDEVEIGPDESFPVDPRLIPE